MDWDSSSDEKSDWDSFNPAKFQVGHQWVNQPERSQEPRQANKNRKVEYNTKKKAIYLEKKKYCLGGTQSKTDTHQNNLRRVQILGVPQEKSKLKFILTFCIYHAPLFSKLDVVAFWFLIGD